MKKLLLFIITIVLISCRASYKATDMSGGMLRNVISEWPQDAKEIAVEMIRKYGQPYEVTSSLLIWENNGPWLKTIVSRDEIPHDLPWPLIFLEQTISYKVSPGKYDKLASFDGNVIVDREKGTLTARCDKEELNFLTLNLAHDVISGRKTAEQASDLYVWAARQFKQGYSNPYLQGLQFDFSDLEGIGKR